VTDTKQDRDLKKTTIEIPEELFRRVRQKNGQSFQAATIEALEEWVGGGPDLATPSASACDRIIKWFRRPPNSSQAAMANVIVSFIFGGPPRPFKDVEKSQE
jgi:hypothetical protein